MITITVPNPTYIISPASPLNVTVTDTSPSLTFWLYEISYDDGGTWATINPGGDIGNIGLGSPDAFPDVQVTANARVRVTNNDTLASATSDAFGLLSDSILMTSPGINNPNQITIQLNYESDNAAAIFTGGDPTTSSATADNGGGPQLDTSSGLNNASGLFFNFADAIESGGTITLNGTGDITFDRPTALVLPGQTLPFS